MGDEDLICSNVTVAVRVRPSNDKEQENENVVDTCGEKTLSVSHPSEHGSKRFTVRFHSFAFYPKCSHTYTQTYSLIFHMIKIRHKMRFIKIWQNLLWTKRSWDTTERYSRT